MPQDRKIEVEQLTNQEAIEVAGFLASVVGRAHGRQMDAGTRKDWQRELLRSRSRSLNAPSWLWTSLVELLADHERGYLDHYDALVGHQRARSAAASAFATISSGTLSIGFVLFFSAAFARSTRLIKRARSCSWVGFLTPPPDARARAGATAGISRSVRDRFVDAADPLGPVATPAAFAGPD
jgi:hypothetical protein